jgi:CheY-like chemotaxis protein
MSLPSGARVLCVEDHQDIAGYICHMLNLAGYQTVTAPTLIEGLRLAKSEHFDLCLLDYNLPDGTGIELCKLIRVFDSETPILFHSNVSDREIHKEAIAAGAQGFITKMQPFDVVEQAITKLIESGVVKDSVLNSLGSEVPMNVFPQEDFDRFVERYNADYLFLLMRASTGQFDCLTTSFLVLKDLYDAIIKLHEVGKHQFRVVPFPITFRANQALLINLGFDEAAIDQIESFLKFVKETQGRDLDDILKEGVLILCPTKKETAQTIM